MPLVPSASDTSTVAAQPAPPPPPPPDPLGRNTPHGCLLGFLKAAEAQDYAHAGEYLDGHRSEEQSKELVIQLKALLDRVDTKIGESSKLPEGNIEDQLRLTRENLGVIKTPNGDLDILLDRVERSKETTPIWLFSQETLNRVPEAYASMQHRDIASYFPEWSARIRFLSVPLWRWALILISMALSVILANLLTRLLLWLVRVVSHGRSAGTVEKAVAKLRFALFGMMLAAILSVAGDYALTVLARHGWQVLAKFVALVSGAWLIVRVSDIFSSVFCHRLTLRMQVERVTFVGLLTRLFKILVFLVLVIVLLTQAGVNVSALVAGLGIGGIALALAAQKTLADLFGGISVILRGAVRVGDFCTVAGRQGTVEEIGISSLRLRTLDRSVISIPNSKVAEMELENISLRDEFWVHQVFTLQFNTPLRTLKTVLDRMTQMLASEPEIEKGSARVRLIGLTSSGPQIEVYAYFSRPGADWAAFLAVQEKIILKMIGIVESEGTSLAAPMGIVEMRAHPPEKAVDSAGSDV